MDHVRRYWFRAKRYGWGWGLPCAWQGWVAVGAYLALMWVILHSVSPVEHGILFSVAVGTATGVLLIVCRLKGEPLRWRWGRR